MDSNSASGPEPEPSPKDPFYVTHSHKMTYGYLFILIFAAVVGLVYNWQHDKVVNLNNRLNAELTASSKITVAKPTDIQDVSVGYPASLPLDKVLTTLYLPNKTDLIETISSLSTEQDLSSDFANSNSDILGYWQFMPQGTTNSPEQPTSPSSNIFLTSMSSWESSADTEPVIYPNTSLASAGTKMGTTQKKNYVANLKSVTITCASDSSKGFTTINKTYNICYNLISPKAKDGNYLLDIYGYGQLNSTPVYVGGEIQLPNSYQSDMSSYINALKNITSVVLSNASAN